MAGVGPGTRPMNAPLSHIESSDASHASEGGPPYEDDDPRSIDPLSRLLGLVSIVRRRFAVVAVVAALGVAGAALAIKLLPPRYRAQATILLHMAGPQVLDKVQGVSDDEEERRTGYRDYYQTQRRIMQSRAVAERALDELGLAHDPVFLGIDATPQGPARDELAAKIDPVERLRDLVSVGEVRNSRVVEIEIQYPDADVAAEIANAVADAYLWHVQTTRTRLGRDAEDALSKEKATSQERLESAEKAFVEFKQRNAIGSIDQLERHTSEGILALDQHAKSIEAERIRLQSLFEEAQRLHEAGDLAAASLLSDPDSALATGMRKEKTEAAQAFAEVEIEYGPKHAEHRKARRRLELIDAGIENEADELLTSIEARLNVARKAERRLAASMGRERERSLRVTELEREYRRLEREAEAAADEYRYIARRDAEIGITNRVEEHGIEILDRATPPTAPEFPRKLVLLAFGLGLGLGVGVLAALMIDARDERIRGIVDLERAVTPFGLPVLGGLPRLPAAERMSAGNVRAQRRQRDMYAHLFPRSLMAERCRGIRTSLEFGARAGAIRSLMVTSPGAGEGKSSTTVNLALSLCQSGKRVLLVDADLRRPRIHQVFAGVRAHPSAGLSTVLAGEHSLEDALLAAPEDAPAGLDVLPSGPIPGNPAELLETAAFGRLLDDVRDRYDVVIVDTPPVLPVADPLIVARQIDAVIVVGRVGTTTRTEVHGAIAQLARGDTNIVGVVLNEVEPRPDRYQDAAYYVYREVEPESAAEPA